MSNATLKKTFRMLFYTTLWVVYAILPLELELMLLAGAAFWCLCVLIACTFHWAWSDWDKSWWEIFTRYYVPSLRKD